jgi:integrase/recombinase XerD
MKNAPLTNNHFEELHTGFSDMIIAKGYSRGKDAHYPNSVREFLFFIEQKGFTTIHEIKALDIIAYYEYLQERRNIRREGGLSDSTIRSQLYSLRLFFDYLLDTKQITTSPARLPKFNFGTNQERNILTVEEIKQLYSVCESKRDKALLSIAYGCGLRRSEIEKLNTEDVLFYKGMLVVKEGKNGKSRIIPLSDNVLKYLKEYVIYERPNLLTRNPHPTNDAKEAFFINNIGTRKKGLAMLNRLKILIERTKNAAIIRKNITLHCLRHSIATHLLDQGATIQLVQQFLGHTMMDTAHLYSKRRKQQMVLLREINLSK